MTSDIPDLIDFENALNKLTRDELLQLNKAIVKRIRFMDNLRQMEVHLGFEAGQRVEWSDKRGVRRTGRVLRVNTKTISVEEDGDPEGIWRISTVALKRL